MEAQDLVPFFKNKHGDNTPYTAELHYVLKNLIQQYVIETEDEFNKNPVYFQALAEKINFKYYPDDWAKKKWKIKPDYLMRLCFPQKDPLDEEKLLEWNVSKWRISAIYKYLDHTFSPQNIGGKYWITELQNLKESSIPKRDSYINSQDEQLLGAKNISMNFKILTELNSANFESIDFYLAKHKTTCQWFGVFKGWDAERADYHKIRESTLNSFLPAHDNLIAAVVCGSAGSGKSTVLRRLAADCLEENVTVFWLTNISLFSQHTNRLKENTSNRYLLIIEDWEQLKGQDINTFFLELVDTGNIRIVIADRTTTNKEYLEYLDSNKVYRLSPSDNTEILHKVLLTKSEWEETVNRILANTNIHNCSIYQLLFVIARSDTLSKEKVQFDDRGITTQFKSTIRRDLLIIYEKYPGLVKALYYWACVLKHKKRYSETPITWEAILKLANTYNKDYDEKVIRELNSFDLRNPICQILSFYVSLEQIFVIPALKGLRLFSFNHDILIEGISEPFQDDWYFDNFVKFKMAVVLATYREVPVARDLFVSLSYDKYLVENKQPEKIEEWLSRYDSTLCKQNPLPLTLIMTANDVLLECYENVDTVVDETYWSKQTTWIRLFLGSYIGLAGEKDLFASAINGLIERGCKSREIIKLHKITLKYKNQPLKYLKKTFESEKQSKALKEYGHKIQPLLLPFKAVFKQATRLFTKR